MKLLRALYPERVICVACGRPSDGEFLCPKCEEELAALRLDSPGQHAAYHYDGVAKELVHRLKYDCLTASATVLAREISRCAVQLHLSPDTVVTWVTMPDLRRKMRGIDHGRVLAQAVALRLGLPARQLLIRSGKHPLRTQRGSSKAKRLRNLVGMFSPVEEMPKYVLLVDDVTTTGATMETCCACLRRAGAQVTHLAATKVV